MILVLLSAAFLVQTASAQKISVLSFENIMTALQDTTSGMSSEELLSYISDRVKVLGVDFKWTEDMEPTLRNAGATSELIETIRRESLREKISLKDSAEANDYYNKGHEFLINQIYGLAIENFNKAIEINPRLGLAYGGLGLAHFEQKNYDLAVEFYSKAIAASPALAFYINRGAAYHFLRNYERAARDFTQVVEREPKNKTAYLNRGAAYFSNDEYEKAIKDFEKVLELDPKNETARKRMNLCQQLLDKRSKQ